MMPQDKSYSGVLLLFLAVSLLLNIWGCGEQYTTVFDLVPQRCNMLVSIDLPAIDQDPDLSQSANIGEMSLLMSRISIDPGTIAHMVIFGDLQAQSQQSQGYFGVILQGSFNTKTKLRELERTGWNVERYPGGSSYYQQGSIEYITALGGSMLSLGTPDAVRDMLDVKNGRKKPASSVPSVSKLLSCCLESGAPMTICMTVPQDVLDMGYVGMEVLGAGLEFLSLGSIGAIMDKIGLAHGFGMSIKHSGDVFPVELFCIMQSEESASFVSGSLNLLKTIASMFPPDQTSLQSRQSMEAINSMRISRKEKEDVLTINLSIPREELFSR